MKRTGRLEHARATNWLSKNADAKNLAAATSASILSLLRSNCVRLE